VAGDGGILRVGQAELGQAGAAATLRAIGDGGRREEAFEQGGGQFVARQLAADRAADQLGAAAGDDQRHLLDFGIAEQRLLGRSAGVGQRAQLPGVELAALRRQLAGDGIGQRQVHVVAAEQDVLADGDAVQFERAFALEHGDQREVAGAAADIDDQDDVAGPHLLAPAAGALLNPAVERRLRLLEQDHALAAGGAGRFGGQFAGGRVEGGGDGDDDLLLGEGRGRLRLVPGGAQMGEIAQRGVERRQAGHFRRRVVGQDRRTPVDAGVAEPALGARHQADRRRRAAAAGHFADRVVLFGGPRQAEVAGGEFARRAAGR
jgi:hypothetical protein